MFTGLRAVVGAVGVVLLLIGLAGIPAGVPASGSLWLIVVGGIGVIVALLEQARYRSGSEAGAAADSAGDAAYRPTEEVFLDPTTGQRMRVWIDPASGERRYRTEA